MSINIIDGNINLSTYVTSLLKNGEEKSYKKVKIFVTFFNYESHLDHTHYDNYFM